jgi:integrase
MINTAFDNNKVGADVLRVFRAVKKLLKKGTNARGKVLTFDEYNGLLTALPFHTSAIVATAFWTGMRKGEILNLTWDKVSMNSRMITLEPGDTKEGKTIGRGKKIPIAKTLKKILNTLPKGLHDNHVFLYRGKPIVDIRGGLRRGCTAAGIPYGRNEKDGFTFHDLRHTTKTYLRKAGVDRNVRMAIFGHVGGNDMDARYDTIDESDLKAAVDQLEVFLRFVDQTVDHGIKKGTYRNLEKSVSA